MNEITYRNPNVSDAGGMWELAKQSPLDLNSSYSYLMMAEYFSDHCMVALNGERVAGFVTGFIQNKSPTTLFIWQVAVDKEYRGNNIAFDMISKLYDFLNVNRIEATVTRDNKSSLGLFRKLSEEYGMHFSTDKGFNEDDFPDDHETEMLVILE